MSDTADLAVELLLDAAYAPGRFVLTAADQSNRIEAQPIPWEALVASEQDARSHVSTLWDAVALARTGRPVTVERVCAWQAAIVREQAAHGYVALPEHLVGRLRSVGYEVGVGGHTATPSRLVLRELTVLLINLDAALAPPARTEDPLGLLASSHLEYERIHPFVDGNGRSGRVLAFHVARRLGIAPVLFTHADRFETYYPAFADDSGEGMRAYCAAHQLRCDPFAEG